MGTIEKQDFAKSPEGKQKNVRQKFVEKLKKENYLDQEMDIDLEEKNARWMRFKAPVFDPDTGKEVERIVEGKLLFSENQEQGKHKLFLATPGWIGAAADWGERWFVDALKEAGHDVWMGRHVGLNTRHEKAENYVNCPERMERGKENKESILGGDKNTP